MYEEFWPYISMVEYGDKLVSNIKIGAPTEQATLKGNLEIRCIGVQGRSQNLHTRGEEQKGHSITQVIKNHTIHLFGKRNHTIHKNCTKMKGVQCATPFLST